MKTLNANEIYDKGTFSRYHFNLLFLLFVVIVFDGYDTAVYGAVVPILMEQWSLTPVAAGAIGSYTVIGTVVGALLFGLMADKVGPKKVTVISVIIFSAFTVLAGFANGPEMFTVCRVIAGLGLGGVMPNVVALTTEFAPKKIKSAMIAAVFCGYSIGSMSVALISKFIIGTMGWQPLYWLAGVMLVLTPILIKAVPESLQILVKQGKHAQIREILRKAVPNEHISDTAVFERMAVQKQKKSSISALFSNKRGFSTVMFWIASFCCFILIYAMNTWLTKLMIQAGYNLDSSLLFLAILNVGAIIACIVGGSLMEKYGFKKVLIPIYLSGSIALVFVSTTESILFSLFLSSNHWCSINRDSCSNFSTRVTILSTRNEIDRIRYHDGFWTSWWNCISSTCWNAHVIQSFSSSEFHGYCDCWSSRHTRHCISSGEKWLL